MAHARARKLASGTWWYMQPSDRKAKPEPCGKGKKGAFLAKAWATRLNEFEYERRAGYESPQACLWTLGDLRVEHLADAKRRGLRTALPQYQGKLSRLESHWRQLIAFFGDDLNLDDLGQTRIREYLAAGEQTPTATNRDLWSVLSPALRLARETEASAYWRDPFKGVRKLDERSRRRAPLALSERDAERFIRRCWMVDQELGAFVELLYLTGSRLYQKGEVRGGLLLHYPPHKRGIARSFRIDARLRRLLRCPQAFDRKLWKTACTAFGRPELRPHDLRHTRLTLEGRRPGASLIDIQKLGGWRSPAMAGTYLHADSEAIRGLAGHKQARRKTPRP